MKRWDRLAVVAIVAVCAITATGVAVSGGWEDDDETAYIVSGSVGLTFALSFIMLLIYLMIRAGWVAKELEMERRDWLVGVAVIAGCAIFMTLTFGAELIFGREDPLTGAEDPLTTAETLSAIFAVALFTELLSAATLLGYTVYRMARADEQFFEVE